MNKLVVFKKVGRVVSWVPIKLDKMEGCVVEYTHIRMFEDTSDILKYLNKKYPKAGIVNETKLKETIKDYYDTRTIHEDKRCISKGGHSRD